MLASCWIFVVNQITEPRTIHCKLIKKSKKLKEWEEDEDLNKKKKEHVFYWSETVI